jgi:surface antigen
LKQIVGCAGKKDAQEEKSCFGNATTGCDASDKKSVELAYTAQTYDKDKAVSAITTLKTECEVKAVTGTEDEKKESWWKKNSGTVIGAVGGGVVGGVLANKIVGSIQDQELNKVEREAFEEFMNTVGSQIRCVISGETVGVYGDIISTQME